MARVTTSACVWLVLVAAGDSKAGAQDEGGLEVTYSSPDRIPELPPFVSSQLKRLGCRVPQHPRWKYRNVVQGQFATRGQLDWAVVCSIDGQSHVHFSWGGPASCGPELLLGHSGDKAIERVGRRFIQARHEAFGGPKPPPITHDAVNEVFVGKAASVVHYCHKGQWIELQGND